MNRYYRWSLYLGLLACLLAHSATDSFAGEPKVKAEPDLDADDTTLPPGVELDPLRIRKQIAIIKDFYNTQSWQQGLKACDDILKHPRFQLLPLPLQDFGKKSPTDAQKEIIRDLLQDRLRRQRQREEIEYYRALCFYHNITDKNPSQLTDAIFMFKQLAENKQAVQVKQKKTGKLRSLEKKIYDQPRFNNFSRYWYARALLDFGKLDAAIVQLERISGLNTNPRIEYNASVDLVEALRQKAAKEGAQKDRRRLLKKAVNELNKISLNVSNQGVEGVQDAEHLIADTKMALYMELEDYPAAEKIARTRLRKKNIPPYLRARLLQRYGSCAFHQADFATAAKRYEQALKIKEARRATRVKSLTELGRSLVYVLGATSPALRGKYLTRAQGAFTQARDLVAKRDQPAITYALAEVLVMAGEYQLALSYLRPILHAQQWSLRANYLAGIAARGRGDYHDAINYFRTVSEDHIASTRPSIYIETHKALAEISRDRGNFAVALRHSTKMAALAEQRIMRADLAEALMGTVLARIGLAANDLQKQTKDNWLLHSPRSVMPEQELTNSLVHLLLRLPHLKAEELNRRAEYFQDQLRALAIRNTPGKIQLKLALATLDLIESRYQSRIRLDEMRYAKGRALYLGARYDELALRKQMPAYAQGIRKKSKAVFKAYAKAAGNLHRATKSNPIGKYAPRTHLLLGSVYLTEALLASHLADETRAFGDDDEANDYQEESNRFLRLSLAPLQAAVRVRDITPTLLAAARLRLGQAFFNLQNYESARQEFALIVNDPRNDDATRIAGTRSWAQALAKLGKQTEAIRKLLPYANRDLIAAHQVGQLLEAASRPNDAQRAYLAGYNVWEQQPQKHTRELAAETLFAAHRIALTAYPQADIKRDPKTFLHSPAARQLLTIPVKFPNSEWAAQALLQLEKALSGAGQNAQILGLVSHFLEQKKIGDNVRQALYLIQGRAFLASGKLTQAKISLTKARKGFASQTNLTKIPTNRRRARAIIELGRVEEALGDDKKALYRYEFVFAMYANQREESDDARLAAARLCLALARKKGVSKKKRELMLQRAKAILKAGHDISKMSQVRREIEKAQAANGES